VRAQQGKKNVQFVALFPQDLKKSEKYLKDNDIAIKGVRQTMPFAVGAGGFPTVMLVNDAGIVEKAWIGKLAQEREREVFDQLASVK
jgi:hypothetical protein